jgi:hypothetical protein
MKRNRLAGILSLGGAFSLVTMSQMLWVTAVAEDTTPSFLSHDFPGAEFTCALAINPAGEIVGQYKRADGIFHGYLLRNGVFTSIDFPGASSTFAAMGINEQGDIVGSYFNPGSHRIDRIGSTQNQR